MASPISQTTTPSPLLPARNLHQLPGESHLSLDRNPFSMDTQLQLADPHNSSVEAFLVRAQFAKLARALRARLSYATYKATHDLSHVPLGELENMAAVHSQNNSPARTRSRTNNNDNRAGATPSTRKRRSKDTSTAHAGTGMMPPPSPSPHSSARKHGGKSLYATLLGSGLDRSDSPSASKRPRISKDDKASVKSSPRQSPRRRTATTRSATTAVDNKKTARSAASPSTSSTGRAKRSRATRGAARPQTPTSNASGSPPRQPTDSDDINAAATLSSLFQRRVSGSESPLSRTSSHASAGPQPLAFSAPSPQVHRGGTTSSSSLGAPLVPAPGTPKPNPALAAASDTDAAELMLFLATSPSPARPTVARPSAAAYPHEGRVLFEGSNSDGASSDGHSQGSRGAGQAHGKGFAMTSSVGNQGAQKQFPPVPPAPLSPSSRFLGQPQPAQQQQQQPDHQQHHRAQKQQSQQTPKTPFNISEYVNVSPSPIVSITAPSAALPHPYTQNTGSPLPNRLADHGRRLFEDDQDTNGQNPAKRARFLGSVGSGAM